MAGKKYTEKKIRIGRLSVDPIFLGIFAFSTVSALLMITYIILSVL